MPEGTSTATATKSESLSASELAETLGAKLSKQIEDALKPVTDKPATTAKDDSPEADATMTATLEQLKNASEDQVLMFTKDGGKNAFDMLTSHEAQARLEQKASMTQLLSPIERAINPLVPNLPLGSLAVGAITGLILGELVDGFVSTDSPTGGTNFANLAVKGGVAIALVTVGSQLMSKQAAMAGAAILTAQILADVLPLDQWIARIRGVFNASQSPTAAAAERWLGDVRSRQPDPISGGITGHDIIADIF